MTPDTRNRTKVARKAAARAAAQRRRRLNMALLFGSLVIVGIVAALSLRGGGTSGSNQGSGSTTAWNLPRLNGQGRIRLADFRGKPTVVNFFASWCENCRFELPGFSKVSKELQGKVAFVGVNSLDDGKGMAMARQFDIAWWPLAQDLGSGDTGEFHDNLGARGMPATVFYDSDGKIVDFTGGALSEKALRDKLRTLYGVEV